MAFILSLLNRFTIMFRVIALIILLLLSSLSNANNLGFKTLTLSDIDKRREINIFVIYPTNSDSKPILFADSSVFSGFYAIENAKPINNTYPLLVISHGYGGNWRNLSWIASNLAKLGYIVALIDHPDISKYSKTPKQAAQLWQRPIDLQRTITFLQENPDFAGKVDNNNISLLGHSLGGWTVMVAGGANFNVAQFLEDCRITKAQHECELSEALGIGSDKQSAFNHLYDPRVKKIIALDTAFARGLTKSSLKSLTIPTLIIGAEINIGDLPIEMESGYLAENLPVTRYILLKDAMHFSFIQECKKDAFSILPEKNKIICKDGYGVSRKNIHTIILKYIKEFLDVN